MTATQTESFKVVLLGEGCVGKTSLMLRYCNDQFREDHLTTIQAHWKSKKLNIEGKRVNLVVWDTAGQERFHALGPIYYRDSNGAILVYDITDKDSFQKVKNWVKELRKMLGTNVTLAIVGNKFDLERNRTVTQSEAETYAASVGAKHYLTSAKLNKGLDELFLDLTKRMLESKTTAATSTTPAKDDAFASSFRPAPRSGGLQLDEAPASGKKEGGGCCG